MKIPKELRVPKLLLSGNRYVDNKGTVRYVDESPFVKNLTKIGVNHSAFEILRLINGKGVVTAEHPDAVRFWTIYPPNSESERITEKIKQLAQEMKVSYISFNPKDQ